jgi:hypothetical protein
MRDIKVMAKCDESSLLMCVCAMFRTQVKSSLGFDPLMKTQTGAQSSYKLSSKNALTMAYSKEMEVCMYACNAL